MTRRTPVVLFDATYYGTLAAVRSLGGAGVPVVLADPARIAPAIWSRHTARFLRCPPPSEPARFVDWIMQFGRREERHVLYPTSDDVALLLAEHQQALARHFAIRLPPVETFWRILDKKALLEAAREAGFSTPDTWYPRDVADVERAAHEARGHLMIKPRTQVMLNTHRKGALATRPEDLVGEYERFRRENWFGALVVERDPDLARPMLQRYYPQASECIYSLTGFRDEAGRHLPLLGAVKVLQRPRRMGTGLCFESAPVSPELAAHASRLLERLGYFGVFELEFLRDGDRWLLIDMNPRFYNQLALDIARGLELPQLAYAAALADDTGLAELAGRAASRSGANGATYLFRNLVGMRLLIGAQRAFGTMSKEEAERWRTWGKGPGQVVVDSSDCEGDRLPLFAEAAKQVYESLRHPRAFLRMIALDRS